MLLYFKTGILREGAFFPTFYR
nr:unnamed protein product [Callosobruchus chinensis]